MATEEIYVCKNEGCEDYNSPRPVDELAYIRDAKGRVSYACPECAWEMDLYYEED